MKAQMENYHELLADIMKTGQDIINKRTGQVCRTKVGMQLAYDLADGFPAITTKKLAFNSMKGELLGFFRGYTNSAEFRALGCKIWDQNANETEGWLRNRHRKGTDDLGRLGYSSQWTDWRDRRFVDKVERDLLLMEGFREVMHDPAQGLYGMERSINQLENALRTLLTNPSDRRIIISGWNIAELDQMALPPCHKDYTFVAFEETKTLHVVQTMRSYDAFLAFNVPTTALFLEIMARLSGYTPGTAVLQLANAHCYEAHFSAIEEQLSRNHFASPRLMISDRVKPVSLAEIPGAFTRIEPEDIWLDGYQHHPAIKAPMAA